LNDVLKSLVIAELIEVRHESSSEEIEKAKVFDYRFPDYKDAYFSVNPKFFNIQSALEISLSELSYKSNGFEMKIEPSFGEPVKKLGRDVFVLMPFLDEMRPVYEDHIKKVASSLELTCGRADDLFSPSPIMNDIWSSIVQSRFIIADCTGKNANVFYEMGIAHTIGKKVIMITQIENDIPFDIRHIRCFKYNYNPRGMVTFEEKLTKVIGEIL